MGAALIARWRVGDSFVLSVPAIALLLLNAVILHRSLR
jgi:hypothetical protein